MLQHLLHYFRKGKLSDEEMNQPSILSEIARKCDDEEIELNPFVSIIKALIQII